MLYLGIDLGGTNIACGLVNEEGEILNKKSIPTLRKRPWQEILRDMAELAKDVAESSGHSLGEVHSVGIGSPGAPDKEKGIILFSPNLNFENVPMSEEIRKYLGLPVYIENDANCAALAEAVAGACKGVRHSVTVTIGTGIGGGIIINGQVYSGFNNAASELGHSVICMGGEPCSCGRRGCFEAYASATALISQTIRRVRNEPDCLIMKMVNGDVSKINAKTPFDAARQGDSIGVEIVNTYIGYLAEGILNIVNELQPEVIAIGGGVSKEGEFLLKPLREIVYRYSYSMGKIPQTRICAAKLGNDAGIIGAAFLGRQLL